MFKQYWHTFMQSAVLSRLIVVNFGAYIFILLCSILLKLFGFSGSRLIADYFFMPLDFSQLLFRFWTPFTYMFLHALNDLWHIMMNMLFLFWFGRIIENLIGESKLMALYVYGGLTGAFLALIAALTPISDAGLLVGASGAVNAIMFAAVTLAPDYTFRLLFLGEIKIKYIALAKFLLDLIYINASINAAGSICHIGGALFGIYFISRLKQGKDLSVGFNRLFLSWSFPRVKAFRKKTAYKSAVKPNQQKTASKISQKKIDAILDKISSSGYQSLTQEEKEYLFAASDD